MSGEFSESTERRYGKSTIASEMYCPACEASYSAFDEVCPRDGTRLVRLTGGEDSLEGTNLDGRFTLLKKLGSGGMGSVYLARQHSVGRDVAIKVIRPELSSQIVAAKRFLREARLASRLNHPHMVSVLEFGQSPGGLLFLVMELLRGRTIAELLKREGKLPVRRAVGLCVQLCDALQAAHDADIVHRDLKPANVFLLDDPPGRDFIKVLDFGLAKSLAGDNTTTQSGQLMGTPAYMAPEAILEGTLDRRSDLYALGVILYEMLDGQAPFSGENLNALVMQQAYTEPPPFREPVPASLQQVVFRLLEKQVEDRYQSAAEVRAALIAAIAESAATGDWGQRRPSGAHPVSTTLNVVDVRPRRRLLTLAVVAVIALSAAAAIIARSRLFRHWPGRAAATSAARAAPPAGAVAASPAHAGAAAAAVAPRDAHAAAPPPVARAAAPPTVAHAAQGTAPVAKAAPANRAKAASANRAKAASAKAKASARAAAAAKARATTVKVTVRARPRARVLIGGHAAGFTPRTLTLRRGDRPVEIEFTRPGRRSVRRTIHPDHNQTLSVFLPRARAPRRAAHTERRRRSERRPAAAHRDSGKTHVQHPPF